MTGRTGIAWSPDFARYSPGPGAAFVPLTPYLPDDHWDTGRRIQCLHDIVRYAGLKSVVEYTDFAKVPLDHLYQFHSPAYVDESEHRSIGQLTVGAVCHLVNEVMAGAINNAYAIVRPAGHHAGRGRAGGGCLFANGVFGALKAKRLGARRVLYLDWDAHYGNGQQEAFWNDPAVLTISIHQSQSFAPETGGLDARGGPDAWGTNINIPVPAGSGTGVYQDIFRLVVEPAAARFQPDLVIVSSGLDGNNIDPSARLRLHAGDYRFMASRIMAVADKYAQGRLVLTHEGGYAVAYIPLCLLAILETLVGESSEIYDPFIERWGTEFALDVPAEARATIDHAASYVSDVPTADK